MTAIPQPVVDVFSWDPEVRRAALPAVPAAEHYVLRQVLLADPRADLRALAATRLATCRDPAGRQWLYAALSDPMPIVREAALRALARAGRGGDEGVAQVQEMALRESIWWVRRTAAVSLAALCQGAAIPTLRQVLADPFWRVRHGAVRALLVLGRADAALGAAILAEEPGMSEVQRAALAYLRNEICAHPRADRASSPLTPALYQRERGTDLDDPDPAVATARLKSGPPVPPAELVALLGHSHEPLREAAARRLAGSADLPALRAVLQWLDEPRVPHAADTAAAVLDRLGPRAQLLAQETLRSSASAAAVAWACAWTAATRCEELYPLLVTRASDPDPLVRRPAVAALAQLRPRPLPALRAALADGDAGVRAAAALSLSQVRDEAVQQELLALPYAEQPAPVRGLLIEAARREGRRDLLLRGSADPHPLPRALALSALAPLGLPEGNFAADPDPWVRAAVLGLDSAPTALQTDPDPLVRRAALHLLLSRRGAMTTEERAAIAQAAGAAPDPLVRARAAELIDSGSNAGLLLLLELSRDPAPMVRAAAADLLEALPERCGRLRALLSGTTLGETQRAAAYAHLIRPGEPGAEDLLRAALSDPAEPELVREQLAAQAVLFGDAPPARSRPVRTTERPPPPQVPLRPLGRTGIEVAPLGLSGAQELPEAALRTARAAGVNFFFWEPSYLTLTRFLRRERRHELVVVAGSFHGDRTAIEKDVERALRRLRTDCLGVFLLFWARSPGRLSAAAFEWLSDLRQAGKIRTFGFSTHDRALALQALTERPWPVVMTRHSAAHPGAEEALLPQAARQGTGVLTFSALCYGRLLQPLPGAGPPPAAADCYRYSLSQPGVAACLSAPRRYRELAENLQALHTPTLPPAELLALRTYGHRVHEEDRRFDRLVRHGAAPALIELLGDPEQDPAIPAAELHPRRQRSPGPSPIDSHPRVNGRCPLALPLPLI